MLTRRVRVNALLYDVYKTTRPASLDARRRAAAAERRFVEERPWFPKAVAFSGIGTTVLGATVAALGAFRMADAALVSRPLQTALTVVMAAFSLTLASLIFYGRSRLRKSLGQVGDARACFACGYPLDGLPGDAICPECGDGDPAKRDAQATR